MTLVDAFGWIGSAILVFSLLQSKMLRLRILNLIAALMLVAYNILVSTWPMVGMNAAVALIDVYYILVIYRSYASARKSMATSTPTA